MLSLKEFFFVYYLSILAYYLIIYIPTIVCYSCLLCFLSQVNLNFKKDRRVIFSLIKNTECRHWNLLLNSLPSYLYTYIYKHRYDCKQILFTHFWEDRNKYHWSSHGRHICVFIYLTVTNVYSFLLKCNFSSSKYPYV